MKIVSLDCDGFFRRSYLVTAKLIVTGKLHLSFENV